MLQGTDRLVLEGPSTPVERRHHVCGAIFLWLLVSGLVVVVIRLAFLQVVRYEDYRNLAVRQQTKFRVLRARRGSIYAMGMRPLVVSEEVSSAFAARSEERRVGKGCRSRWSPYP